MQYLHILEVAKKLNGRFSQFNTFADTAVLSSTAALGSVLQHRRANEISSICS